MTDQMVLATQQWLNKTYRSKTGFGSVPETGRTGWDTINALIRALQIELGITATANNFGPGTQREFKRKWPNGIAKNNDTHNVHGIIQGALWCKGYPAEYGGITTKFSDSVAKSISQLKGDIGFAKADSTVDLELMMALLSMKQFRLLSDYGGKASIRSVQKTVNLRYKAYTGIVPTDGLYGREMNTALIQVLQAIEGFTPGQATGNFGNGTRSRLQTISGGSGDWVWLASVALICNGYLDTPTRNWSANLSGAMVRFQNDYALPATGVADPTTWMSLLTSKGDPNRACVACDTRFEITDELAECLKADGYQIVGRYLSEPGIDDLVPEQYFKAIRPGELRRILRHGLKFFPIFQEYSTRLRNFTPETGARHAKEAVKYAKIHRIPPTVIYFAVDYDATDPEVTSNILPYFKAVNANLTGSHAVGIYASRNICQRVIEAGYAVSAFVSDMSTGFSGNLGFPIPDAWNYDQFHEIHGYRGKWDLDRVAYSGRVPAVSKLQLGLPNTGGGDGPSDISDPLARWVFRVENAWLASFSNGLFGKLDPVYRYKNSLGEFILQWLRKPEYWSEGRLGSLLWKGYTPEPNDPSELLVARNLCALECSRSPVIKGTLPGRDIAHMAATALGYLIWGVDSVVDKSGPGELGGWPLDLLQIWGQYLNSNTGDELATWLDGKLGIKSSESRFGYDDVLADADAWLIARFMQNNRSEKSLSTAMKTVFKKNEKQRITTFYHERFGGKSSNVAKAFKSVLDGIDTPVWENVPGSSFFLKKAAGTDQLPNEDEASVLARKFTAFIAKPL